MDDRRRRGRPPGLLVDPTPTEGLDFTVDVRVGWLLRSWRLYGAPDTGARAFSAALVEAGVSADPSRLSRWETGRLAAPLDVVAAYETALGLTRSGLVAFCISARKLARPDASAIAAVETHRVSADRFEQVLEEVVDGEPTGADWLDFGSYVATHTDHVILPTSLWRTVATRLLRELGLSVGPAYATRSEAALLLARHARARPALTHSIGQYVTTPDSLLVADPIALLQSMDTPQAGDLTLLLLEQPPGQIRYGAAWVAAAKVRRKQFDETQMHRLEAIVVRMVREDGLADGGLFNRVADLVAVLPDDTQDRIRQATHTAARVDPLMAAASDVATKTWPRSLVVKVCSGVARPSGEPDDPLLERLVEEALFHRIAERRFHASLSLALSPYGPRIAAGCARLVARALDGEPVDPQLVEKTLVLLTFIGTEAERDLLCRVAEGDADTLRTAAYVCVAHLPPAPGESRRPAVVPLLRAASPANEAVVRAALYCAGMTADPVLHQVRDDADMPEWVRRAASWWLREGPACHEPIHRGTA